MIAADEVEDLHDLEDLPLHSHHEGPRLQRPSLVGHAAKASASLAAAPAAGVPGAASVWVKTYGCSHNTSDGEYMAGMLSAFGYR